MSQIFNISPIDGRYAKKTQILSPYFSEYALIKFRVITEIKWLLFLAEKKIINENISETEKDKINLIAESFCKADALRVKEIENETKHDVKAVEYFLREKLNSLNLSKLNPFVHIMLTSEDTNSISYALILSGALEDVYFKNINNLVSMLGELSKKYSNTAILGHTHGQPATPTTVGKEFKVFEYRINNILNTLKQIKVCAKCSGAVGNYNCHIIAYPNIDWINLSKEFVESLNIQYNPITTQIESHDVLCLILSHIKLINNIVKDLNSDMWLYISRGYFYEKLKTGEVGSSVMPHKVNPINHENSMANTELSNGLIDALVNNLQVSRMQRDLSDSSKLRNLGVIFAHSIISISETLVGLNKLEVNQALISEELENNYVVLSEAVQTVLRKNGIENAYELLKGLSRGKELSKQQLNDFVKSLNIPESDKAILTALTPNTYIGLAKEIAES